MFDNVSVVKKANVYFDGKVSSRTIIFSNGEKKTLGIMLPGEYEFGTDQAELMEIQTGEVDVLLPGQADWQTVFGGENFTVPSQAKFGIRVKQITDYVCSFID